MTNADWWHGVRRVRERHEQQHVAQLAWQLRKAEHAAVLELRPVQSVGVDLALMVDGELLKSRLFRAHEQRELAAAVDGTKAQFVPRRDHSGKGACTKPSRGV